MARCEDFPCCGSERGTSYNGQLYGSDEAIKARVEEDWRNGHGDCDHEVRSIISGIWPDEDDEDGIYCEACREYREVIESGSSEGFTGSPIHWATLSCGHQEIDDSADSLESTR